MTPDGRPVDQRGLTLIELVLTLTILAIAGALVSGALTTGLRAWRSGMHSGREELVARIALERIATQLRAAVPSPARRSGAAAIAFDAGESHLRFVTLAASGRAPVQVSYQLTSAGGDPHLVYREYPWPDKEFFNESNPIREETVVEITGFTVQVVKRGVDPDNPESLATADWSPLDKKLPASVGVEIVLRGQGKSEPRHFRISVPLLSGG